MLAGRKVIITGGSSGIGKAIAISFCKNGADIAIFSRNEQKAKDAVLEIEKNKKNKNQKILYKIVDVSKSQDVEKIIMEVLEDFKVIDILVNNAGITKDGFLIKMKEEDWDSVLDINLKSIYNTCKIVCRNMIKERKGKIINISSIVGLVGNSAQTNYAASKAGMIGFTKSLAKELALKNIYVNCIAPGFIKTDMTGNLPDKIKQNILNNIPMRRFGKVEEIAEVAVFLASDMSSYITGQVITVDGGMVI
ncbi:MAG: hypothetical protein AMS24_05225 [Chlamydiae bacterium SM23_39]|nr:MAG: hypothetical protein AMS24_05225 [Chlamydiae bacterium SM23_39]